MISSLANWYPGHWILGFCSIVAAAVVLVSVSALAVSLFFARHPAARHWVLLSALVTSLISPVLALAFVASGHSLVSVPLLIAEDAGLPPSQLRDEAESTALPPVADWAFLDQETAASDANAATNHWPDVFRTAVVAILLIWLCGTLFITLRVIRSGMLLRRFRRSLRPITDAELGRALEDARRLLGMTISPAVSVSSQATVPIAVGLFQPVIVLPKHLLSAISCHQLRDILMHEMAHIERRDNLIVLLEVIGKAVFWPIPFVHLLNRELERAREEVCDNYVLTCQDAVSYGETLLRIAQLSGRPAAMPIGAVGILHWPGRLERRVSGLIHKRRNTMTRMHPLVAAIVLVMFVSACALLCGTTIVVAQEAQEAGPLGIRNEIDRFMQYQLQRDVYAVFLERLQLDLLKTLASSADQRQFAKATGKQRVAIINDMLARAAKEKKWDDAKKAQMKEKVLEMLLSLDEAQEHDALGVIPRAFIQKEDQVHAVPQADPAKPNPPNDAKPGNAKLSDADATAIRVWIGSSFSESDRTRILGWYRYAQRDERNTLSPEQRDIIERWINGK